MTWMLAFKNLENLREEERRMTNVAVNSAVFDVSMTNVAVVNTKKASGNDFGKIFDEASGKVAETQESFKDKPKMESVDCERTDNKRTDEEIASDELHEATTEETVSEEVSNEKNNAVSEEVLDDNAVNVLDEDTHDAVMEMLAQIIEQIKEVLGVSDEEILAGMESIGLTNMDLLDSSNMSELIAAIDGDTSKISIVADETKYAAMQELVEFVDEKSGELMQNTGLTGEELEAVLQKMKELEESKVLDLETEQMNADELSETAEMTSDMIENTDNKEMPVVVTHNNTTSKAEDANTQADTLTDEFADEVNNAIEAKKAKNDEHTNQDDNHGQQQADMQTEVKSTVNEVTQTSSDVKAESYTSTNTENIMRQITDFVKIVKTEQLTEMELQLHPASLGNIKVSLASKGGVVTAEFITQNEVVKSAIEAQAAQLKVNLEEQGIKVEAVEVSVESHQLEKNLDQNNSNNKQTDEQNKANRIQGTRKKSINLRNFESQEDLLDEAQEADDATRIAMEMMAMNGNSMDLLA